MTITVQQNQDIISLPLPSSNKTSRVNVGNNNQDSSDFVLYSARHGVTVIVSCNEFEFLDLETQLLSSNVHTAHLPLCEKEEDDLCCPQEEDSFDNFFNDDDSSSISSYSYTSSRKVTFADTLVTDVWIRPRTPVEDCKVLFYSYEDTQRFRRDYRLERKLQANNTDPALFNKTYQEDDENNVSEKAQKFNISRVVVLHNNTLETFYDEQHKIKPIKESSEDFFDNDSFWTGSLQWF